eukprot:CAMPEP_0206220618 /NCGR_PEP_ID=MMETSP0047_2-20121206/4977_1 /ASSEMBLY_ACC=CAM_ASM_000192 /TAXON_ID=195065 /ORGANISM="Chroomonas mesostigmatica_cf, Strain CCMP1168" /LENGTH=331 /DNA_ID=CAMNT_0053643297 /DNA_START=76 /DNA_END=1068 /DNA_ORIENTATION=-
MADNLPSPGAGGASPSEGLQDLAPGSGQPEDDDPSPGSNNTTVEPLRMRWRQGLRPSLAAQAGGIQDHVRPPMDFSHRSAPAHNSPLFGAATPSEGSMPSPPRGSSSPGRYSLTGPRSSLPRQYSDARTDASGNNSACAMVGSVITRVSSGETNASSVGACPMSSIGSGSGLQLACPMSGMMTNFNFKDTWRTNEAASNVGSNIGSGSVPAASPLSSLGSAFDMHSDGSPLQQRSPYGREVSVSPSRTRLRRDSSGSPSRTPRRGNKMLRGDKMPRDDLVDLEKRCSPPGSPITRRLTPPSSPVLDRSHPILLPLPGLTPAAGKYSGDSNG